MLYRFSKLKAALESNPPISAQKSENVPGARTEFGGCLRRGSCFVFHIQRVGLNPALQALRASDDFLAA
jgi:hypothetical protein